MCAKPVILIPTGGPPLPRKRAPSSKKIMNEQNALCIDRSRKVCKNKERTSIQGDRLCRNGIAHMKVLGLDLPV